MISTEDVVRTHTQVFYASNGASATLANRGAGERPMGLRKDAQDRGLKRAWPLIP